MSGITTMTTTSAQTTEPIQKLAVSHPEEISEEAENANDDAELTSYNGPWKQYWPAAHPTTYYQGHLIPKIGLQEEIDVLYQPEMDSLPEYYCIGYDNINGDKHFTLYHGTRDECYWDGGNHMTRPRTSWAKVQSFSSYSEATFKGSNPYAPDPSSLPIPRFITGEAAPSRSESERKLAENLPTDSAKKFTQERIGLFAAAVAKFKAEHPEKTATIDTSPKTGNDDNIGTNEERSLVLWRRRGSNDSQETTSSLNTSSRETSSSPPTIPSRDTSPERDHLAPEWRRKSVDNSSPSSAPTKPNANDERRGSWLSSSTQKYKPRYAIGSNPLGEKSRALSAKSWR